MGQLTERFRLDEILVRDGLVKEEHVRDALMRQKAHGGKFGSQLLYNRYIDEAGLVTALATQMGCEGVVLAKLDIPEPIFKLIPSKVAIARKVIPFDYDPEDNILKIACENPTDKKLIDELNFVARGKTVKLYVAAELALNTSIARHYLGRNTSLDDNLLLDIPDETTEVSQSPATVDSAPTEDHRSAVMLVTDEEYCGPLLQSILERDNYRVMLTDSADDAIEVLNEQQFNSVFIKDTVPGDYIDLIDRLRKTSPSTSVRYYESASELLLNIAGSDTEGDLLLKSLSLFTSLLSSRAGLPVNHGGRVGQYVDRLCRRIGLPNKERFMVCSAAYLHNLAGFYYQTEASNDPRAVIKLTVKVLQSLDYSPVVVEMLRCMYKDLGGKYNRRLPIEVLGGNILTIVDLFCDNVSTSDRLSLDKFDAIKKKLYDLRGKLFLHEVVEAFISMMQEQMLHQPEPGMARQVMIYVSRPEALCALDLRLRNEGFRTVCEHSLDSFIALFQRSQPDMVILILPGDAADVTAVVNDIQQRGVDLRHIPSFLLVSSSINSVLTPLIEAGIEDVIPAEGQLDLLISKLKRIAVRDQSPAAENAYITGSRGRLSDMNLIDLLQALGPSCKTVKLTISPADSPTDKLTIYLRQGQVSSALYRDKTGPDAIYDGIAWTEGTWTVKPVTENNLPEPNNDLPNESILMEGCRVLDESTRRGQLT
ncbi:MAG: DUF4388 domain-containing protein [bacterium]